MILTDETYYSQEANLAYMSVSQYKDFAGTYGKKACEEGALAKLYGRWDDGKLAIMSPAMRCTHPKYGNGTAFRCVGAILLMKCAANPCLGMSGQSSPKSMAKSLLLIALQIIRGAAAVK